MIPKILRRAIQFGVRCSAIFIPMLRDRVTPVGLISLKQLDDQGQLESVKTIYVCKTHQPHRPICLELDLHPIFEEHLTWQQPAAKVAKMKDGRVWGRRGCVLTSHNELVGDLSREFGAYKGICGSDHPVFQQLWLPKRTRKDETIAVIATPGSNNFHHWLYDTLPRLHLLQEASIDIRDILIIADFSNTSFQRESLRLLGIKESKIITPGDQWSFHCQATNLIVTTLPSELGTVSRWVLRFLREIFMDEETTKTKSRRLYVSRQRAPSRRLANQIEVESFLFKYGFEELFAEEQTITETAAMFSQAEVVVSVHGSGLSNLVFASAGVKVVDLLPPSHLDTYYWLMTDQVGGQYAYIFGKGERPPGNKDLVRDKIDDDINIDVPKLAKIFELLGIRRRGKE